MSPALSLRIVGAAALLLGGLGLAYNASYLSTWPAHRALLVERGIDVASYYTAFATMSGISIAFHVATMAFGWQFLKLRTRHHKAFAAMLAAEVIYMVGLAVAMVPLAQSTRELARAVSVAFAVSNGGLILPMASLFFLWGPWLVFRAHRKLEASPEPTPDDATPAAEP